MCSQTAPADAHTHVRAHVHGRPHRVGSSAGLKHPAPGGNYSSGRGKIKSGGLFSRVHRALCSRGFSLARRAAAASRGGTAGGRRGHPAGRQGTPCFSCGPAGGCVQRRCIQQVQAASLRPPANRAFLPGSQCEWLEKRHQTSTLHKNRADFMLLRELLSKIPWEEAFEGFGMLFNCHLLKAQDWAIPKC